MPVFKSYKPAVICSGYVEWVDAECCHAFTPQDLDDSIVEAADSAMRHVDALGLPEGGSLVKMIPLRLGMPQEPSPGIITIPSCPAPAIAGSKRLKAGPFIAQPHSCR